MMRALQAMVQPGGWSSEWAFRVALIWMRGGGRSFSASPGQSRRDRRVSHGSASPSGLEPGGERPRRSQSA